MRHCLIKHSLIACCVLLGGTCSSLPDPASAPMDERVDSTDASTKGLKILRFDVNRDKRPDIWKYYKKEQGEDNKDIEVLVRKEIDLNADGQVDVIRFYDASGIVTHEKLDMDFDHRFDVVNYYKDGVLVRKELDLNFDMRPDLFKFYKKNKLLRLESDKDWDGIIDYWEYYEGDKLDRVGYDIDGDGKVDRMERRATTEDEDEED